MLIRRTVLDAVGMLDGTALIRGYGEEVDWCMRARAAGWRHLQATGVFVAHEGTVSFRAEKTLRVAQNRSHLVARYPSYYPEFVAFRRDDPLASARTTLRTALERSKAANWLQRADMAQPTGALPNTIAKKPLPAVLPPMRASCQRIAIWKHDLTSPAAEHVLRLARLLASRSQLNVRMLVIGDGGDALWRTGVVDHVPHVQGDALPLLDDLRLLQAAGCRTILTESPAALPAKLKPVLLDEHFDAHALLAGWSNINAGIKAA